MWFFNFPINPDIGNFSCDENGWKYKFKRYSIFAFASLITPVLKEVTESKGTTVRYVKRNAFCLGFIKNNASFCGVAFFELPIRLAMELFCFLACCMGFEWESSGFIVAFMLYLLITVCAADQDGSLFTLIKRKLQS